MSEHFVGSAREPERARRKGRSDRNGFYTQSSALSAEMEERSCQSVAPIVLTHAIWLSVHAESIQTSVGTVSASSISSTERDSVCSTLE
jgi:hypothetical protein